MRIKLLYAAYGWLLLGGLLHFGVDVISQYVRGKRAPSPETTLYYGLNTAYALGQVLVALLAILVLRSGSSAVSHWPGLTLGFTAAAAWLAICFLFLEYSQPRMVVALFAALLACAALAA
ncbi:hypothetical protein [Terriglobus saanensis]|uniref:Uncharacterized protein n=1 Tax=Terriglobus saanensis (strain ATCC BAA-1853 / DSM 23119 / SP1PR4) TaxID=401053 RepID=E8V6A3_TERSS|nr:hypothetical protein [Terriglobus saanensis]ADV81568.1 hypothetical protein AciPR4_0735 [Terriglobus saanensis SP1PR4]